jgi:hypothetical protein
MGYPSVIYNPQRPEAGFTLQDFSGRYLTPTGDSIYWDTLRTYVLSGFSSLPSAADVRTAQRALGIAETGELDGDTMAAVVNVQLQYAMTPTGVPDAPTLAKIGAAGGSTPKKKKDGGGEGVALAVVALAVVFLFRGR